MNQKTQQEYLQAAKADLAKKHPGITWDEFAALCGIEPRAFKTYRMPETSKDYRAMSKLVRDAVDRAVKSGSAKGSKRT